MRERLALFGVLLAGCADGELNLEVTSLATEDHALYEHSNAYLTAHRLFDQVEARLDCPEEDPGACLLRLEASERVYDGAASSLIVYVATGVQPLPGAVDLSGAYQYGVEPVTYATIEDVGYEDPARRYNYVCTWTDGVLTLEQVPAVGEPLSGQFDLSLQCLEQLAPDKPVPARLEGVFEVVTELPPY